MHTTQEVMSVPIVWSGKSDAVQLVHFLLVVTEIIPPLYWGNNLILRLDFSRSLGSRVFPEAAAGNRTYLILKVYSLLFSISQYEFLSRGFLQPWIPNQKDHLTLLCLRYTVIKYNAPFMPWKAEACFSCLFFVLKIYIVNYKHTVSLS